MSLWLREKPAISPNDRIRIPHHNMATRENLVGLLEMQLEAVVSSSSGPQLEASEEALAQNEPFTLKDASAELVRTVNHLKNAFTLKTFSPRFNNLSSVVTELIATGSHFYVCRILGSNPAICAKYPSFKEIDGHGGLGIWKKALDEITQEMRILCRTSFRGHKNIITLHSMGWMNIGTKGEVTLPVLYLEHSELGSLSTFLSQSTLGPVNRLKLASDVAKGLRAIHMAGIAHGDLKPDNVLIFLDERGSLIAKISDFGSATGLHEYLHPFDDEDVAEPLCMPRGGTPPWNAPEWRKLLPLGGVPKLDCYSFGLLTWSICLGGGVPFGTVDLEYIERRKAENSVKIAATTSVEENFAFESSAWGPTTSDFERFSAHIAAVVIPTRVFNATLDLEPAKRNLMAAMEALSLSSIYGILPREHPGNEKQLDDMEPPLESEYINDFILLQDAPKTARLLLVESFKDKAKRSDVPTSVRGLTCLQIALIAIEGFAEHADPNECLDWLMKSAEFGCEKAQGIVHSFFSTFNPEALQTNGEVGSKVNSWLVASASSGSPTALDILRHTDAVAYEKASKEAMSRKFRPELLKKSTKSEETVHGMFTECFQRSFGPGLALHDVWFSNHFDTLLHFGASYGVELGLFVRVIDQFDPDLDCRNGAGDTPLIAALRVGNGHHAKVLLEHGASAGLANKLGQTPCHWLIHIDDMELVGKLLDMMIAQGVDMCRVGERNDIDMHHHYSIAWSDGTPLHWAVGARRIRLVQALLERGANPLIAYRGDSVFDLAVELREAESLGLLLAASEPPPRPGAGVDAGQAQEKEGYRNVKIESSWLDALTRWPHHFHIIRHANHYRNNFRATLSRLQAAGMANFPEGALEMGWAVAASRLPQDLLEDMLGALGGDALSVDVLVQVFGLAVSQSAPHSSPLLVESIIRKRPQMSEILPKLLYPLVTSLNPPVVSLRRLLEFTNNADLRTEHGTTLFCEAVEKGNFEIATVLLDAGANVNALLPSLCAGYDQMPRVNILHNLIVRGNDSVVSALDYLLAPHHPFQSRKPSFVVHPSRGVTALHVACSWDSLPVFHTILRHFRDPVFINATDLQGGTALHHAAFDGCFEQARVLCDAGALLNAHTHDGTTPVDLCRRTEVDPPGENNRRHSYQESVLVGRLRTYEYLRRRGGEGSTPEFIHPIFRFLHKATETGMTNLFDEGLKMVPGTRCTIEHLNALLFLAARNGHHLIVQRLINVGAELGSRSAKGRTPLHAACRGGDSKTVQVLLLAGADKYAKDDAGTSPIRFAFDNEHFALVRTLMSDLVEGWCNPKFQSVKDESDAIVEREFLELEEACHLLCNHRQASWGEDMDTSTYGSSQDTGSDDDEEMMGCE